MERLNDLPFTHQANRVIRRNSASKRWSQDSCRILPDCYSHFTEEKTKAQKSPFDLTLTHNKSVAKLGFRLCPLASAPLPFTMPPVLRKKMDAQMFSSISNIL